MSITATVRVDIPRSRDERTAPLRDRRIATVTEQSRRDVHHSAPSSRFRTPPHLVYPGIFFFRVLLYLCLAHLSLSRSSIFVCSLFMANVPPSTSRPLSAPSILRSLEVYESSSDSDSERSEDYVTAEDPESTDYDEDLEDLVSAMSQVTTAEVSPGRLGVFYYLCIFGEPLLIDYETTAVVSTSGSAPASPSRPGPSRPLDPDRRTNPTVQTTFKRRSLYPSLDDVPSPFPSQPYLSTLNASGKMYLVETREGSSHRVDHWYAFFFSFHLFSRY